MYISEKNLHLKRKPNGYVEGSISRYIPLTKGNKKIIDIPISLIKVKLIESFYELLATTRGEVDSSIIHINENDLTMRKDIVELVQEIGRKLNIQYSIFFNDMLETESSIIVTYITNSKYDKNLLNKDLTGRYVYLLSKSEESYELNPNYYLPYEEYRDIIKSKGIEVIELFKDETIKKVAERLIGNRPYFFFYDETCGISFKKEYMSLHAFLLITPFKIKETVGEMYNIKEVGMIMKK